jgi:hypothetical protein
MTQWRNAACRDDHFGANRLGFPPTSTISSRQLQGAELHKRDLPRLLVGRNTEPGVRRVPIYTETQARSEMDLAICPYIGPCRPLPRG